MKIKLIIAAIVPLLLLGCDMNELFDKGDVEKTYDGPPVVEFKPLQQEVSHDAGAAAVKIQLIGEERDSDLTVNFSVSGESTAVAGEHYNLATSSPASIEAGSFSVDVVVEVIEDSVPEGDEVRLVLDLEGGDGVDVAENLKTATVFIAG